MKTNAVLRAVAGFTMLLAASGSAKTTEPPVAPGAKSKAAAISVPKPAPTPTGVSPVARGAYLAGILGCAGCHTPWKDGGMDGANLYAGNPPHEPGKSGTPNITPDQATGIGAWTDAQTASAIREARRPDGTRIAPKMPCAAYRSMSDTDAAALVAFLRTIKPVVAKIDRVTPDPVEVAKWPVLASATGTADAGQEPGMRGGYLAGLLRCEGCHTPPADSKAAGKRYAGGKEFKGRGPDARMLVASNITPDTETGIGTWTVEEIAASITELVRPDGSKIKGPMNFHADEWVQLTDGDAKALGAFLKSLPAVKHKVGGPGAAAPAAK